MRHFNRPTKKSEKGQVLIILALTALGLIAMLGLAIDTGYLYVSYARLRRAVDAAGLAATGEFKRPPSGLSLADQQALLLSNIAGAAKQMLKLNGIVYDTTAAFADPVTGQVGLSVETCDNAPGDPALCKTPPQKLVRIKVQESVPIFFLAVVPGFPRSLPITVNSISQAASLDVVLLIDSSESMAWYNSSDVKLPFGAAMRDPKTCNESDPSALDGYKGDCYPFQKVKAAASNFIDQLYFPYDRVAIVTFDQVATVDLELNDDPTEIETAIQNLEIFEGMGLCDYNSDDPAINFADPGAQSPVPPLPYTDPNQIWASCRLLDSGGGLFVGMSCPLFFGPTPSLELCGNTNPGAGFAAASNTLAGVYPPAPPVGYPGTRCVANGDCPPVRDDAVWVVIFLSDGAPNSAFATDGTAICPPATQSYAWLTGGGAPCRDKDSNESSRHNSSSTSYDPDDFARDMVDILVGNNAFVFSIAMPGSDLMNPGWTGTYPPAQALLRYAAVNGDGDYYDAATASELNKIFLAIANKIATRINQ